MSGREGLFVGIGIDAPAPTPAHARGGSTAGVLDHAVADVVAIRDALSGVFSGEPALDADENAVRVYARSMRDTLPDGGNLFAIVSGHGVGDAAGLRLLASDSSADDGVNVLADIVRPCVASGANQLLFVVDTCYSGQVIEAGAIAQALLDARPPEADHLWIGVLTSCSERETARDGVFGQALLTLLRQGPTDQEAMRRWSVHNEFIYGHDLCDALIKQWGRGDVGVPCYAARGSTWFMIPNPRWTPGAPAQVVEHLLRAARSQDGVERENRSWFTGRRYEVNRVVSWVTARKPNVYVVTGPAGTGKSAIVGRVVSVCVEAERRHLGDPAGWGHADPGVETVLANVHARGLTVDRLAELLDRQLSAREGGALMPRDGIRNANQLIGDLQQASAQPDFRPPVIVVDGLDEARGEARTIADDLLLPLARYAVMIVSTRDLSGHDTEPGLVDLLGTPERRLDLGDPEAQLRTRQAIREYIVDRLQGVPALEPGRVADHVLNETSMAADLPFLVARLTTSRLRDTPVDTGREGWQQQVATSVGEAFDRDLTRVTITGRDEDASRAPARVLLTALSWGYGAGLPEREWLAVAESLASPGTGVSRDDVSLVLGELGRYVIEDGESGVAVYRLAHQSLSDLLHSPFRGSREVPFDPRASAVTAALLGLYSEYLDAGLDATSPRYLWNYAWVHAASGGPEQVGLLRGLAHRAPALMPDVAAAQLQVAARYSEVGRRADAIAPTEEAVTLYRAQAAENRAYLPDLAMALNNLGVRYSEVGRRADAIAPTEEAVTLRRAQAAENRAYLPNLAMALNNLLEQAQALGKAGRAEDLWVQTLASFSGDDARFLTLRRVQSAEASDPRATEWLAELVSAADDANPALVAALRDAARLRRQPDPDLFDAAWIKHISPSLPLWLTVPPDLLDTARQWIATPTYEDEQAYLTTHIELLTAVADTAIDEALLPLATDAVTRLRELRQVAQADGVDAAYQPLLLRLLALRFLAGTSTEQRGLIETRGTDLRSDVVHSTLSEAAQHDEFSGPAARAQALIALADHAAHGPALDAIDDPELWAPLLRVCASADDPANLYPLAVLALTTSAPPALAMLYLAVAHTLGGRTEAATDALATARKESPDAAGDWIALLASLGKPGVLPLIQLLSRPPDIEAHQ